AALMRSAPLRLFRSCRADRSSTESSAKSLRVDPDKRFDRAAFVHGLVGFRNVVEVSLEIEYAPGIDAPIEDVVEQHRDVGTRWGHPAAQPDVPKNHGLHRVLDAVGNPNSANDGTGSGDAQRSRHRLACTDAFEGGVNTHTIR